MDINFLDNRMVLVIMAALIAAAGWFIKWLVQKTLNAQFDKIAAANLEEKKEREYDQYLSLRGQQVTNDCLHELIYAAINGTHNGGLQKANDELEAYRALVDQNLVEKAARWTSKITN